MHRYAGPPHPHGAFPILPAVSVRTIWLWIAAAYLLVIFTNLWAAGLLPAPEPPLVG